MILYSRDFPTKGYASMIESLELRPLCYEELVNYMNNDELTDLRKYKKDIELLLKMVPDAAKTYLIDTDYILYMMKMVTISKELTLNYRYTCQCCGKKKVGSISTQSIVFRDIDERYLTMEYIELGGEKLPFKLATINDFNHFLSMLPRQLEATTDLSTIKLASMFWDGTMPTAKVIDLIKKSTGDEIKLITFLKAAYLQPIKPITLRCEKGGETVVTINDVTTDLFQQTIFNRRLDTTKIHFKQVLQDDEHREV